MGGRKTLGKDNGRITRIGLIEGRIGVPHFEKRRVQGLIGCRSILPFPDEHLPKQLNQFKVELIILGGGIDTREQ